MGRKEFAKQNEMTVRTCREPRKKAQLLLSCVGKFGRGRERGSYTQYQLNFCSPHNFRFLGQCDRNGGEICTLDICSRREETAFSGEDGEDGVRVLVEFPDRGDRVAHEISAKGVERLGSVQLDHADLARHLDDDVGVLVRRHDERWWVWMV